MEIDMEMVRLGKTELYVTKNGFGALPVQRVGMEEAAQILRRAYDDEYLDAAQGEQAASEEDAADAEDAETFEDAEGDTSDEDATDTANAEAE